MKADELYESINQLEEGDIPLSPGLASKLLREFKNNCNDAVDDKPLEDKKEECNIDNLTTKQRNVLVLAAKGLKYKDIADILGIKERTVKYYMTMILDKLHMENRNQAIKYVIQKGIVD